MSVIPIAIGFLVAAVGFVVSVPWLVRESRRPLRVAVPSSRSQEHGRLSTVVICAQSILVSILPRHTTPKVSEAADTWRHAFADGRRCESRERTTAFAPKVVGTTASVATVADTEERVARRRNIKGRSKMSKAQLQQAVDVN